MANQIKFYRLGSTTPVEYSVYQSKCTAGAVVFARVAGQNGSWNSSDSILEPPAYYIWANGIEYKVANADALEYAISKVNILIADDTTEGSIAKAIKDALIEHEIKIQVGTELPSSAKHGDYFIVENTSGNFISRTAYIWNASLDGTNKWQALDGNVNANNVYFPEGVQRTEEWGVATETTDIQVEGVGKNLKELLELYLVKETYPAVSMTPARAVFSEYTMSINKPGALSTYVNANNSLLEVGTDVTFKGISLTEHATHNGAASQTSTKSTITGMRYGCATTVGGEVNKAITSKESAATTAIATYVDNFDDASVLIVLDNQEGFTGINDASAKVDGLNEEKNFDIKWSQRRNCTWNKQTSSFLVDRYQCISYNKWRKYCSN